MTEAKVLLRTEIPPEYTWNAAGVFESHAAWQVEFDSISTALAGFAGFRGRLSEGPATLAAALEARDELTRRVGQVLLYARMSHAVDTTDQTALGMYGQAQGLYGQALAAVAFVNAELLAIGEVTLRRWLVDEGRLAVYDHYVRDLFRRQAHVRSAEVEELLGALEDPFGGAFATATVLTNAEFEFRPAIAADGTELAVTQGTLRKILSGPDRQARHMAWESYADAHLAYRSTLATNLMTAIKQDVFRMRARRYDSSLEASLFTNNVPAQVFHNLIDTVRKNLPTWYRYWAVRRQALGYDTLHPYDIWAPLTDDSPHVAYDQAVEMICAGMAPLGDEYVGTLRRGCLEDRWVDVYPNQGKRSGAFSAGSPGTHPFIMMSFTDDLLSLSTLAHELGHSMHSFLTWQHQPVVYSRYSLFAAEVASNFNQAMVRAHLMETNQDPVFLVNLIDEAMANFHRYFFVMPILARFEHEVHQRVERGQSPTADDLIALMADMFSEGYGGEVVVDRERVGITWATFPHLFMNYYVFQYATGIAGAHALARRILAGEPGAVEDYLGFLKAGGSEYPLDGLKRAGVDLATPEPVEEAFAVMAGMVDTLEELVAAMR